ncbi:cytidylyltransferase domain-containing protein [Nitrincola sp. MINF-07-Sa-05]|uniref:cytidylyltransferase domain-containing protein n=1 Tax=Nitrincola salilacus TaxID=3400273 RepID=UPI003917C5A6
MRNIQLIIQARMTSSRLPGKVMLPLCSRPVLQVMIERLFSWRDEIIVATTNDGTEQPITELCERLGVRYFRGETLDVLGRYYHAASEFGADDSTTVVRLTSDCPLIDDDLTSRVIAEFSQGQFDMVSLGPHSGYPRGLDCCAFSYTLLKKTHHQAFYPADREHVTLGMAKFGDLRTKILSAGKDLSNYRLTLDEQDDYKAIMAIYNMFMDRIDFSFDELIETLERNPQLVAMNEHVKQKEV